MLTTKATAQARMERSLEQPPGLRDLILQVHGMQMSPQVQCIQGCLHRRPGTYLFKSSHPWLWKGSHASLGGHRRRLTSFQLCVVWLQCASGIQNSLLPPMWPCTDPSLSRGSAVWYHWCSELGTASCLGYRKLYFRSAHVCGVSATRRPC